MESLIYIAGEPYTVDDLFFKTDPEAYMWQVELTAYMESCFAEEYWR